MISFGCKRLIINHISLHTKHVYLITLFYSLWNYSYVLMHVSVCICVLCISICMTRQFTLNFLCGDAAREIQIYSHNGPNVFSNISTASFRPMLRNVPDNSASAFDSRHLHSHRSSICSVGDGLVAKNAMYRSTWSRWASIRQSFPRDVGGSKQAHNSRFACRVSLNAEFWSQLPPLLPMLLLVSACTHAVTPFSEMVTNFSLRNELSLYSSMTLSVSIGKNGAICVAITSPPCLCRATTSNFSPDELAAILLSWSMTRCNANAQCSAKLLFHTCENGIFWLSVPDFARHRPMHFKLRFRSWPLS